jgi:starch-binding outer membrane protein SusE/F
MKNIFKSILTLVFAAGMVSCEDESNFEYISKTNETFNIITPQSNESVILNESTPNNPAISLTWERAPYSSPAEVQYVVQIGKAGENFANGVQDILTTSNTNAIIKMGELNTPALIAGAVPFIQSPIEIRIKATIGTNGVEPVYSAPITYQVTTFGCLGQYAVGAGLPDAGWNWNTPISLVCENNILTMRTNFANNGNDSFRIFTEAGNWGSGRNYPYYANAGYKISSALVNANDGDQNFKFVGTTGIHKMIINEVNKSIQIGQSTVTSGIEPTSYWLVGAATPGGWSWDNNNETELRKIGNGVYEAIFVLTSTNDANFRLWTANNGGASWGEPNRNFPWYVNNGYTIDADLINANDGDSNFKYVGPTGLVRFKIDDIAKTITVD